MFSQARSVAQITVAPEHVAKTYVERLDQVKRRDALVLTVHFWRTETMTGTQAAID
jgi:hypothetical protein